MKTCKICEQEFVYKRRGKICGTCSNRKHLYGLSVEDLRRFVAIDKCECCGGDFKNSRDKCVDHCHDTGEVRGLICNKCNVNIGHYENMDFNLIEKYLQ